MKVIQKILLLFFLSGFAAEVSGQVTIWREEFPYADGTTQGSGTPPKWTRDVSACTLVPPNDYFEVRSNQMAGRDLDGEAVWTSETIDISSYSNVNISTDVSMGGNMEASDYIHFYYKLDGGPETFFAVNGNISNDFSPLVASQSGLNGTSLVIVVRVYNDGGQEVHRFDNMWVYEPLAGDDCSNAIPINEVTDMAFSTSNATASGENPGCGGGTDPIDLWYAYTATSTGQATFDLCGSGFDTRIAVWDACGGAVLACNDDNGPACSGLNASVQINVTNGTTYYVQVGGYNNAQGNGDLTIFVVGSNDDCANARAINEVTDLSFTTTGATAGGDNPGCGGTTNPVDIWYIYTPTMSGTATIDLCGSSYDTRLAVWDGCGGTVLACNDDNGPACTGQASSLAIPVTAGTQYWIQVGGYNALTGDGDLTISVSPANDDCSNAIAIYEVTDLAFTTTGATAGGDNPGCGGGTNPVDIWFAYTATATGTASFDLCGSDYDTRLAVWDACGGTVLACNDDDNYCGNNSLQSYFTLSVTSGTTYYVQVGGYNALTGNGDLTIYLPGSAAGEWIGVVSTDWSTTGNWASGLIPTATTDVKIINSPPNFPVVDETADCNNLLIENSCSVTISTGADLRVGGDCDCKGSLIVNDGICEITGDLNNSNTALVDVNGGVLSMDGWYESGYFTWASGVVELTGGTINVTNHVAMSNANGTSKMDGPFNLNVGGTVQMQAASFSQITGGTITLTGSGYVLPPSGDGTFAAYNLKINGTGTYVFARDARINRDSIVNNFEILSGTAQLQSPDGTGLPQVFKVGNHLTVAPGATFEAPVNDSLIVGGDLTDSGTTTFNDHTYEVDGNVMIASGAVLHAGTGTFTVEGNWINNGVFNHNLGTVRFNGTSVISGASQTAFGDLLIASGKELTGPSSDTISIELDFTNNGTFHHNEGTVLFNGTTQAVQGTAQTLFNNLIVDAGSTTDINTAGQTLRGILKSDGTLNANGNLTLVSDATQTALIDGTGSGSVNGSITMQRYLPSGFGYKYYSSPFTSATVNELADDLDLTASFPTFYRYDESRTSAGWVDYTDPAGALTPMHGYAANFGSSSAAKTTDISGTVNNGTLAPVTLYNHNNTYTKGFNLMGNPYPSPIDWDAAGGWTRTNIDDAIYFFNAGTTDQYVGTYSSYINGVSSDGIADNIIASMQGFFIHVSDGTYPVSGTFGMANAVRVNDLSPVFHKSAPKDDIPLIRLTVSYKDATEYSDAVTIYFDENSSSRFEKSFDALKLMNTDPRSPNLYAVSNDWVNLSIQSLPFSPDSITIVSLGIRTSQDKNVIFRATDIQEMPYGMKIYLRDTHTGLYFTLNENQPVETLSTVGEFNKRFSLVFALKDIRPEISDEELYYVYASQGTVFTGINTPAECEATIKMYDLTGRLLFRQTTYGNGYHSFKPNTGHGIYIVTVATEYGQKSYKIYF